MYIENNNIPKYKKKKRSSTSKAKEKSNHAHEYEDCLFIDESYKRFGNIAYPRKGTYCKICGKIGNVKFFESNEERRLLDPEEIYEKYKDLKRIPVDDVFQKYISIENIQK